MSRIGKLPIEFTKEVTVSIKDTDLLVKGPKGELKLSLTSNVNVDVADGEITVKPIDDSQSARSMWGTTRTLISNMVVGVTTGFTKDLEFNGVGYKASVSGNTLNLSLGYSHPIAYDLPAGISAKVTKNIISISGSDKALVGFAAAKVRSFRKPEPYKGKGIKYVDEVIIRKAGKSGAKK
ncbi:MAG: 50S ribosomal protein L6 [Halobacteriovoraceae bacterium]|nr:50S ribosomal protein L6 [Halobacteriovoraceae bacterium]|tara:strand:+ start:156 stop:695 length:540 start_codon:yes stop_codon:yes gene_type:complete